MTPPRPSRQINLLRGWPSPTLHPSQLLRKSADRVLAQTYEKPGANAWPSSSTVTQVQNGAFTPPASTVTGSSRSLDYDSLTLAEKALLYGPDPGHMPLRIALGKWLWHFYGPAIKQAYPAGHRFCTEPAQSKSTPPIPHERITITGGASQSMDVIMNAVTDPTYTRKVWVVAPGYYMVFKVFRDAGFGAKGRMVGVPEMTFSGGNGGKQGPNVRWLREKMEESEREWEAAGGASEPQLKPPSIYPKIYKHVIYTVPSFANPSSITTSLSVREDLVRCAREFDALIICDDVYDMLQWRSAAKEEPPDSLASSPLSAAGTAGRSTSQEDPLDMAPLPRLVDVDRFLDRQAPKEDPQSDYGNVLSNGTFSKICGPGCRNGWIEGTPTLAHLISQEGAQKSGGAPGQLVSTFLCDMLERGELQQHVRSVLRPAYEKRWRTLVNAVRELLVPLGVEMPTPHGSGGGGKAAPETENAGGYFIWLTLPDGVSERAVTRRCLDEENLIVAGGRLFEVPGDATKFNRSIRLCFAWEAEEELKEGVVRLGRALRRELDDLTENGGSTRAGEEGHDEMRRDIAAFV